MNTARDTLIEKHAYLIPATVDRLMPPHLGAACREDAEGEGFLALVKAADRYDPRAGRFWSFALSYIRGGIREYLRREELIPRRTIVRHEPPIRFLSLDMPFVAGEPETLADLIAAPGPTPEEEALGLLDSEPSGAADYVRLYLGLLPAEMRFAVWAFVVEDMSTGDVGRLMRRYPRTAVKRRESGLERLREMMTADGWGP